MLYRRKLHEWTGEGLITHEQSERIQQYEEGKGNRSWIFSGFLLLGVTAIAVGILSVVAANWDKIQPGVKLALNFILLAALINLGSHLYERGKSLSFQIVLVLYYLLIPASIGLISQVFNTSGEFYQAMFLWTLPSLPLVLFARTRTMIYLWLIPFTIGIYDLISVELISSGEDPDEQFFFFLFVPGVFFAAGALLRRLKRLNELSNGLIVLSSALIAAGTVYYQVEAVTYGFLEKRDNLAGELILYAAIALLFFIGASSLLINELKRNVIFLLVSALLYLSQFTPIMIYLTEMHNVVRGVVFILIAVNTAIFFARTGRKRMFDLLLAVSGIRFLILYFEAFGGLMMTGIGLILSGLGIITLTAAYLKLKDRIYKISGGES